MSLIWDAMSCGRTKGEDESPPESRRTNGDIKSLLRPGTRATGVLCTTPSNLFLPVHVSAIPGYIFFLPLWKSPRHSPLLPEISTPIRHRQIPFPLARVHLEIFTNISELDSRRGYYGLNDRNLYASSFEIGRRRIGF